MLSVAMPLHTD